MKNCRRIILVAAVLLLLAGCAVTTQIHQENSKKTETEEYTREFFAMDTYISMTAYGNQADEALTLAQEQTEYLESLWSVTQKDSEVYSLNHSNGLPVTVSDETAQILSFSLHMAEETEGCLDPTLYPVLSAWGFTSEEYRVPSESELKEFLQMTGYEKVEVLGREVQMEPGMMMDLGAVGKGYASDEAAETLRENGIDSALIDFGGNILTIGEKQDGTLWRLGIKDPYSDGNVGTLEVSDCAVVTSGNYERYFTGEDGKKYGHIINPATGYPVENDLASVTVIASDGKAGDALSTPLFVMGREAAEDFWREHGGFEMILITTDGEIYLTDGVSDQFTAQDGYAVKEILRK